MIQIAFFWKKSFPKEDSFLPQIKLEVLWEGSYGLGCPDY